MPPRSRLHLLQRRAVFRPEYAGTTLRSNVGLAPWH
jgi:hypothetical protein